MLSKLIIGGVLVSSSLLASSSATCQLWTVSQIGPTVCSISDLYLEAWAHASAYSSYSGNSLNAGLIAEASIEIGGQIIPTPDRPTGGAYAAAHEVVSVPTIAGDSYKVTFNNYEYGNEFGPTPAGFPLSGCTLVYDGENCSFTLSAAQLASVSTFSMDAYMAESAQVVEDTPATYLSEEESLTISQFDAAGDPVDFALAPEPGTVGLSVCAFLLTGLMIRIRKAVAATVRIREQ